MQVQHSYNLLTKGWVLLTHVLTLSATDARIKILLDKNRTHDLRTSKCASYLVDHLGDRNRLYSSQANHAYLSRNRSVASPQVNFYVARNTLYSSRADHAYRGCPSACHPLLQVFSAEITTGSFPVLLFCTLFSTLGPVRRTRF